MYESPIKIYENIQNEIVKQKEEYVLQAITKIGVNVDKEELIRALQYDRNQYKEGFEDGAKAFVAKLKEGCPGELILIHFSAIDKLLEELVDKNH